MGKEKIKKEIEYLSKHQELDKFNYNEATSVHFVLSVMSAIQVGLITLGFTKNDSKLIILTSLIAIAVFIISFIVNFYKKDANEHFIIRENMTIDLYKKLGVEKERLDEEFVKRRREFKIDKSFR